MAGKNEAIAVEFPYQSKFIEVHGSKMHYIDEGQGEPILFLHGVPTSNYIWRNIIPWLSDKARCIAPDLIGMGKSDKPDIDYRVFDHIKYIEGFIKALNLSKMTLVLHGWGSLIGFSYASRNEAKIKGLAFFEAYVRPLADWKMLSLPMQELLDLLRQPDGGYEAIINENYLVDKALPGAVLRKLTEAEMQHYRAPFLDPKHRKVLWQYLQDLPLPERGPQDVIELVMQNNQWLQKTPLPKLLLYALPGFTATIAGVQWCRDNLNNLKIVDLGEALHCPQETNPKKVGEELSNWYKDLMASAM